MLHWVSIPLSLVSFGVSGRDFAVINCLIMFLSGSSGISGKLLLLFSALY